MWIQASRALQAGILLSAVFCPTVASQTRFGDLHAMLAVDDDPTESMALGDVDGDGDLDVVFGNGMAQNRLLLNDGTGALLDATGNLPSDTDATCAVVLGDIDGDGDPDLFLGNGFGGQQNRLYLNDGTGIFSDATATHLPVASNGSEDAAFGDVDGDGDLDLLIGNDDELAGQQNRLYLNDGAGVFSDVTATRLPVDAEKTEDVALGDVDGDGDLDAVFANDGAENRLYVNDGLGFFSDATANLPALVKDTESMVVWDVDGDGDLDIVFGNSRPPDARNRLYENDGAGVFTDVTATHMPVDADDSEGLAIGDVDGDGDADLLVSNFLLPDRLDLNDGSGVFSDASAGLPEYFARSTTAKLGDLDGDGDLDAIVAYSSFENRMLLGDGAGSFAEPTANVPTGFLTTEAVALADLDGDGDLDVLLADSSLASRVQRNNGAGAFTAGTSLLPGGAGGTHALGVGDVDGDGDLDVFRGNEGQNKLLKNDGGAIFSNAPASLPAILDSTRAAVLADVDGDGDLDALLGNLGPDGLLTNDGLGVFADATAALPADADETRAVAVGDLDGDGDLDAILGNGLGAGQGNRLLLGDGAGGFSDGSAALPAHADETGALALGDVDGDGDLDVAVANGATAGQPDRLYLGDGLGGFTDAGSALPPDADATGAALLADLDGDGDPDLLFGNGVGGIGANRLLWNDGAGTFTAAPSAIPARTHETTSLAAGDVDGDGDLDLLIGNHLAQTRLLTNLSRQVSWRGEPRIAKPLTMDLAGTPGGPWFLAYAIASAQIPLPPFGKLFLDPASLVLVASGSLDASGEGSTTIPIPPNPTLVGLEFPWQAVLGSPLVLSNLECTRFTDL